MRVLVCGGRKFDDARWLNRALDEAHATTPFTLLIHGDAPGADRLAALWAEQRDIMTAPYPADWAAFGHAAGPIRNKAMLDDAKPDFVIAFPGRKGTRNMTDQARAAGVPIREIR